MKNKVLEYIRRNNLCSIGDNVLVALSGGADSVALLHTLLSLKSELGITVCAAHLNHNIRGVEAKRDEAFVRELCEKLGVQLNVGSEDIPAFAQKTHQSLELAARNVRYEFLENTASGLIATAHNANDNLETMLFNLTRGTGITGLCAIPEKRGRFIRPLLCCTRAEIEAYLKENNLSFVTDSTNLSDEYTRNKIRHNIVPVLTQINPEAFAASSRTAELLKTDNAFLEQSAKRVFDLAVSDNGISVAVLKNEHKALAVRVLKMYYEKHFQNTLDYAHLELLYGLVFSGKAVVLPNKIIAKLKKDYIIMKKSEEDTDIVFSTRIFKENIKNVNSLFLKDAVDCDKIIGELVVRYRLAGDKIRIKGSGGTKTLKKLYNENSVPLEERRFLPVAADGLGVIWVYGIGVAERVAVTKSTENIIGFSVTRGE